MERGLDGYFSPRFRAWAWYPDVANCVALRDRALCAPPAVCAGVGLEKFPVAIAWGKHLFPFRTEKLSPTAPMVLVPYGTGRVGRRRFLTRTPSRPTGGSSRLSLRVPSRAGRR